MNLASPWLFFAVTFGLTWVFWIPAALVRSRLEGFPVELLLWLGGAFGKALPAVVLPYVAYGRKGWRGYWRRVLDWRSPGLGWYAVALLACPVFSALGILSHVLTGGSLPTCEAAARFLAQPGTILPFTLVTLVYGPLPEELGWTAYGLDRLQARHGALVSAVTVGVFWAFWHLPLFFIPGTWHHDDLLGSLRLWTYLPATVAIRILQVWLYNNTGRSAITAVLVHFMLNAIGEVLNLPDRAEIHRDLWTVLAALAVAAAWRSKTLTGRSRKDAGSKVPG